MQTPESDKVHQIDTHVAIISQRVDHLEGQLDDFRSTIAGPYGEIPDLKTRMKALERAHDKAIGVIAAIMLLSGFLFGNGPLSLLSLARAMGK